MEFEKTAVRVWKRLTREERLAGAVAFWHEPPEVMMGTALAAIVKARRMRPQAARALSAEEQARALAAILDPGEPLASALLVALHLAERRAMLTAFLDAVGLPHENGVLKDEPSVSAAAVPEEASRKGIQRLLQSFPADQVRTYLNTLWLQDPQRWGTLETVGASFDLRA